jgi:ABC-type sugar transport system permease subunit
MSTVAVESHSNPPQHSGERLITLAQIWHVVLAISSLAGGVFAFVVGDTLPTWARFGLTIGLLLLGVLSAIAAVLLRRRDHRGRVISLFINYLGFVFCVVALMQLLGIFTGLDALAGTFGRGVIFLGTAFFGYLFGTFGERFDFEKERQFKRIGRIIIILSAIAFLVAVGIFQGILSVLSGYDSPLPFIITLGAIIFGLTLWLMWRQATADIFNATNAQKEALEGYLFLSPNLLGFIVFFAGPLMLSLYVSFTNSDAFNTPEFIGLDNYAEILNLDFARLSSPAQLANEVLDIKVVDELTRFTIFGQSYVVGAQDKLFWTALGNTLKFVIMAVPLSVIPALFLANLLNSKLRGMKVFRAIYFLPSIAAVVGIALVWQWLFNSTIGYINYGVTALTDFLTTYTPLTVDDPQIQWLSQSDTALIAVVIMSSWQWIGFNTVLFMAGLQGIPRVLYEAATVDGAGSWAQFHRITIPLLAPTTFFVMITAVVQAMQVFEQVFILIPGQNPAGPGNSTLTMVLYLYQKGFQRFEQGYASAIAWVLFFLIFGATLVQFRRQSNAGTAYDT